MNKSDFTEDEWDWLIARATAAARRNASELVKWHRAFAQGLLEAIKELTEERDGRPAL
jgi:hypothetical protein